MEGLDTTTIADLMSGKRTSKKPKKWAMLRNASGLSVVPLNKGTTVKVGSFQGKVGSIKRSRKGGTSRMPNGERYYLAGTEEIIAYRV